MWAERLFSGRRRREEGAHRAYAAAVAQARLPVFYTKLGVADTLDGRFDMIALHVYLVLRRLRTAGEPGRRRGQEIFDLMFDDMDRNLREMGVGDLGVGRRVKAMATAMYGRISAYDEALDGSDESALEAALGRNVYRVDTVSPGLPVAALAAYVRGAAAGLSTQDDAALLAGDVAFPAPQAAARD